MTAHLTADDILPLIARLPIQERERLFHLILEAPASDDAIAYATLPPSPDEFSADEESMAWEAEGWEEFY